MNEILIRDCGRTGWVGIWIVGGKEFYRTGRHFPTAGEALERVQEFMAGAK